MKFCLLVEARMSGDLKTRYRCRYVEVRRYGGLETCYWCSNVKEWRYNCELTMIMLSEVLKVMEVAVPQA